MDRFNRLTIRNFSESYIVIILISVSGNCIVSRTDNTGISSTHLNIILWSEEFSSLNSKYVYNEVAFDGDELEGDVS